MKPTFTFDPSQEQLPPVPSGFELLDMAWRDLAPFAEDYLSDLEEVLTESREARIETQRLYAAWLAATSAEDELRQTSKSSLLRKSRKRAAAARWSRFTEQTQVVFAAIAAGVSQDHPTALPPQVLLLTRDRFRQLLLAVVNEVDD